MARIRIPVAEDDGRALNGATERVYALPSGAKRVVDIDAAGEGFTQEAFPARAAE